MTPRQRYWPKRFASRRAFLDWIKTRPCLDCKHEFPPCAMDFDHVRGEKKFNVGQRMAYVSAEDLQAEIMKCDVVCANCHRVRSFGRKK